MTPLPFDGQALARQLGALAHAARVHDVGNRAVTRLVVWAAKEFHKLALSDPEARIELEGGILLVNGNHVRARRELRAQLAPFSQALRERGTGGIRILPEVDEAAVEALFRSLNATHADGNRDRLQAWLDDHGARSLRCLPPRSLVTGTIDGAGVSVRAAASEVLRAYLRAVVSVQRALADGSLHRIPPAVHKALQHLAELAEDEPRLHLGLASIKSDTDYDARHPVHAAILAMAIGKRLGLHRRPLVELAFATLLIAALPAGATGEDRLAAAAGMVSTPRLSPVRLRRMLILAESGLAPDRSGEPELPLVGPVHLFARIAAIACAFDEQTTSVDGRPARLPDEALAEMLHAPRLDTELVRILAALLGRYPLGSGVRLDSGEIGVVFHAPSDPLLADRPVVRLVRDMRGQRMDGRLVDLGDPAENRRVVRSVDLAAFGIDPERAFYG